MYKLFIAILFIVTANFVSAQAQTTAFNFQGRLNDGGSAANSNYDFQFKLFDAIAGGTQVGSTATRANLQVINGVFSTVLDFGAGSFSSNNRFLEISVRPAGSPNAHVVLGARQQILAVPFAVQATNSTNSTNATNAQTAVNSTTSNNALALGGTAASEFARLNFVNPGDLKATGQLVIDGNARQNNAANGLVKAMIEIGRDGSIQRCYNGANNTNTGNCGFAVTQPNGPVGVYRIFFGFAVNQKFVSVTPIYGTTCNVVPIQCFNAGANYRFINTDLEVFTFDADDREDTTQAAFTVIVF